MSCNHQTVCLLSLICCSVTLLLLCHSGTELHCEILRVCDHGSLLQMQSHCTSIRPANVRPAQSQDCSEGQGETVNCSNWNLIKISAHLSAMSQAVPSCTILIKQTVSQSKICLLCSPKLSQRHTFVVLISSRVSTRASFYTSPSHNSRQADTAVLPYRGCKQRQHVGHLVDRG